VLGCAIFEHHQTNAHAFHLAKARYQRNSTFRKRKQISCISVETVHFEKQNKYDCASACKHAQSPVAESSFSDLTTLSSLQSLINTNANKEKLILVVLVSHNKVIEVLDVPLQEILEIIGRNTLSQKSAKMQKQPEKEKTKQQPVSTTQKRGLYICRGLNAPHCSPSMGSVYALAPFLVVAILTFDFLSEKAFRGLGRHDEYERRLP
jgi:hypothetical protein